METVHQKVSKFHVSATYDGIGNISVYNICILVYMVTVIIQVSSINITWANPKSHQFNFSLWLLRQCSFPLRWSKIFERFVLIILHLAVQLLVGHQWPVFLSCPMTSQNGGATSLIHRGYQWFLLSWSILQYHLCRQSW